MTEPDQVMCRTIRACRSCGSTALRPILSLGRLYVSNFVDDPGASTKEESHPLDLVLCDVAALGCGLLQLRHTVSPHVMYRNYWYRSGVNRTMVEELRGIAREAQALVRLQPHDIVVDIGCNDGTLLRSYGQPGLLRVGFEPGSNLISYATQGTDKIFNDFFQCAPYEKAFGNRSAKVVSAIAMFYDLDNPNAFVADVARILDRNGIFIVQMSYLPLMLQQNAFDNICHEHLEYYALASLERLLNRHRLEVVDVELNDVNGGSFRIYIRHQGSRVGEDRAGRNERIRDLRKREADLRLHEKATYDQFAERVEKIRTDVRNFIESETRSGRRVYVYGASTKGNTLLQFFQLDVNMIPAAADRNPLKWGKRTIGTNIPIVSEEQARAELPDYFLVLPWHFLPEFLEREKEYRAQGGKFIIPLPEFKIL